jgi:hypothetical protein
MNIMRGILRLWVVFSIIWIILAIWAEGNNLYFKALVASFPRYISQPSLIFSSDSKNVSYNPTPSTHFITNKDDCPQTPDYLWNGTECMAAPGSAIEKELDQAKQKDEEASRQQEADDSRAEMTLYAIFYIFMPPLLLAIFGMLALWVYRGFRPRRAQNS